MKTPPTAPPTAGAPDRHELAHPAAICGHCGQPIGILILGSDRDAIPIQPEYAVYPWGLAVEPHRCIGSVLPRLRDLLPEEAP